MADERKSPKIVTENVYPPIPVRFMDWVAHYDDPEGPTGTGATEAEAVRDLMDNHPRSGNPCPACGVAFFDGDTCGKGGCPMGDDV